MAGRLPESGLGRACAARGVLAAMLVALFAGVASAQQPASGQPVQVAPGQPYRGLFGAGTPAAPGSHAFDLSLTVYEEYGNDREGAPAADQLVLTPGWFTGVRGGLSIEKAGRNARVGLRTEASARYYNDTGETTSPRYRAEVGLDTMGSGRRPTSVHLGGTFEYEPYYVLPLFSGAAPVTGGTAILPTSRDDLLFPTQRSVFAQSFSLERQMSARSTFSLFEDVRYTQSSADDSDVRVVRAGARLGRRFTRYAALRLGYAYQVGQFGAQTAQRLETHDIDVSIDYRRPLPRLRRTTFGFSTGSSLVTAQPNRRWDIVGNANLRHEFNEGWFLQADFVRNGRLVEGFSDPFFQNTVSASLGGFLGRRIEMLTSAGYSRGAIGFGTDRYRAVQGAARLRLALARYMALGVEGLLNQHRFDAGVALPSALPTRLDRWSVRGSLSLWLPLSR